MGDGLEALRVLVTLSGGAGAGKTTLAAAMASSAPVGPTCVLHGDDYYFQVRGRGVWVRDEAGVPRLDVGDPRSLDVERLGRDTETALAGSAVAIVEGLFVRDVAPSGVGARFDVFVDLAADLRLVRKIERKCFREGFPLEVLLSNYLNHRRAAHDKHVEPLRDRCDLVVDGNLAAEIPARQVWTAIAARGHVLRRR